MWFIFFIIPYLRISINNKSIIKGYHAIRTTTNKKKKKSQEHYELRLARIRRKWFIELIRIPWTSITCEFSISLIIFKQFIRPNYIQSLSQRNSLKQIFVRRKNSSSLNIRHQYFIFFFCSWSRKQKSVLCHQWAQLTLTSKHLYDEINS